MYDTTHDLPDDLAAGPDALAGLLAGVDGDPRPPGEGRRRGLEHRGGRLHLRDAEERAVERVRAMRDEDNPPLGAYDQDAWAIERDYAADDLGEAAATFARHRADHVATLRSLPACGWVRGGRHAEHGSITIENHTIHIATHDVQHLAQIARALRDERGAAHPAR